MPIFTAGVKLTGSWGCDRVHLRHTEYCWLRRVWADQSQQTGCSVRETGAQSVSKCFRECEKTDMFFFSIKVLNPLPVLTQNKVMNLKMSRICLLYITGRERGEREEAQISQKHSETSPKNPRLLIFVREFERKTSSTMLTISGLGNCGNVVDDRFLLTVFKLRPYYWFGIN